MDGVTLYSHIVIGGGLSGLYVCRALQYARHNWLLLEARPILGGRLKNDDNGRSIDMGGAWIWPTHQPHMRTLVTDTGVRTFRQPDDPSSTRVVGGAVQFIHSLASKLDSHRILLDTPVSSCRLETYEGEPVVRIGTTGGKTFLARRVILAAPPRLIDRHVSFHPPLSTAKQTTLRASHTWMAGVTKASLVYPSKFWEDCSNMGLPGTPAFQVYDASTHDASVSALTFFTLATAYPDDDRLVRQVATQMRNVWKLCGRDDAAEQAFSYIGYHVQRWPLEAYISEDDAPSTIQPHPVPSKALSSTEWNGALLFAGSESDLTSPGVMEGSIGAAKRVLKDLKIS